MWNNTSPGHTPKKQKTNKKKSLAACKKVIGPKRSNALIQQLCKAPVLQNLQVYLLVRCHSLTKLKNWDDLVGECVCNVMTASYLCPLLACGGG